MPKTLTELAANLADRKTTALELVRDCLDRIADPDGEGAWTFLKVHSEPALSAARAFDVGWRCEAAVRDVVRIRDRSQSWRVIWIDHILRGSFAYGNNCDGLFAGESRFEKQIRQTLEWFYPQFGIVPKAKSWSGPIDRSLTGLPFFGHLKDAENVAYALGYSGNGVGPAHLGGRILASIVLGLDDEYARLPLVGHKAERFPPEPLRYMGARVVRAALARREAAEDAGRKPSRLDVALAGMMPGGMVPVNSKKATT